MNIMIFADQESKLLYEYYDPEQMKDIDELKVKILGKKGELTGILKGMGKLAPEERPVIILSI